MQHKTRALLFLFFSIWVIIIERVFSYIIGDNIVGDTLTAVMLLFFIVLISITIYSSFKAFIKS